MTTGTPDISAEQRFSITQAAKVLGASISSIDRWTRMGLLRCHYRRHNGQRYWLGGDLLRFWKSEM